jgi:hypothetical protein
MISWQAGASTKQLALCLLAVGQLSFAQPVQGQEQAPAFHLSSNFSRKLQRYSGITTATDFVLSRAMTFGLWLRLHGKVKARIGTYSLTDLLAGKLRAVEIKLADSRYRGVPFGRLQIASATPVWIRYLKSKRQSAGVVNPILLKFSVDVCGQDIANALASPEIAASLRAVKLDLPGLGGQQLQFLEPKVAVRDNAIAIKSVLITAGAQRETGVPITLTGTPELVANSKIFIRNLQVDSPDIPNPKEFAEFTSQLLNPLIDLARKDRLTHAIRLDSLKIQNDRVEFNGNLLLAPRVMTPSLAQKVSKR